MVDCVPRWRGNTKMYLLLVRFVKGLGDLVSEFENAIPDAKCVVGTVGVRGWILSSLLLLSDAERDRTRYPNE